MNKPIYSPDKLKQMNTDSLVFVLASMASADQMANVLRNAGVQEAQIIQSEKPLLNLAQQRQKLTIGLKSLLYYPVINDKDRLSDLLSRVNWYLPERKGMVQVTIPVTAPLQFMGDPNELQDQSTLDLDEQLRRADLIVVWSKSALKELKNYYGKIACVDPEYFSTTESDIYRHLYYWCLGENSHEHYHSLSQANFAEMLRKQTGKGKAYVFGTGPSLERASEFDFKDGFNIVCNSIVKNVALLDHIQPDAIAFADPVFHFSYCDYAAEFRARLLESVERYNCYCLVPDVVVPLLLKHYPQLEQKIIGISTGSQFNFPSVEDLKVKAAANILTLLMIPVASAIANEVYILGCDGRRKQEDYFWKHSEQSQFVDRMQSAFSAHPSFFRDRIYADYYDEHCLVLESLLNYGEEQGKTYRSLTYSLIPALQQRAVNP